MSKLLKLTFLLFLIIPAEIFSQISTPYLPVMTLDVGNIQLKMDARMGDGGLQTLFSYNIDATASAKELMNWPRDEWASNMLCQIFNPISLDEKVGIVNQNGARMTSCLKGSQLVNNGITDWAEETRRYRPPIVKVDGVVVSKPYTWKVDPGLKSDIKLEFEDVLPQFGIRSHVEIYAFSNPYFSDFFIWKATHKFTGEITTSLDTANYAVRIPDQTIRFWWPIAFSFDPSKAGVMANTGSYGYEGDDDRDSWFSRKSELVTDRTRDSLYVAYYYDGDDPQVPGDDTGDPDKSTGYLHSTQVPGYALLYADKSATEKVDSKVQPYAMSHAGIVEDFWSDTKFPRIQQKYRGDYLLGRFPGEQNYEKGPMRFIVTGPYELTKDASQNRYDSLTFVYAVGAGSIGYNAADSIGRLWFNKKITDSEKKNWVMKGVDSLWKVMDRANWAWERMSSNQSIPTPPPPPDVEIITGSKSITVKWSYPEQGYFNDAETGKDDWNAWRVYRKKGAMLTGDPLDKGSGEKWEVVFETSDRNTLSYEDTAIVKQEKYFYAVTALDDGTQNSTGLFTGRRLESSRFANMTDYPAIVTGVEGRSNNLGFSYALGQNYPNPFNPSTTISYTISKGSFVELKIYDMLGREVTTLVNKEQNAGEYKVNFNASGLPSGVYIYSIRAGEFRDSKKLALMK
ncbi:MAG: T9SS type A sorting domain-containing protein [Ignavibacteria bacterium]|jgi:hypothetical protein|nr:T9SS type A sorting domain-containing protein [Ignavibacteria bacterium]MCU7502519.1 T9SS type A sorting domain-containing protein [Ignavibacteria bacterium]MCU7515278.1 T9SS type A sorting domain-containing protein [Ignavibacteria bacterium]